MATVRVTVPLPVPDAGESVNQAALSLADQAKVPPPVLLMLSVCAAGFVPPCCAVNDKLAELTPMDGFGGVGGGDRVGEDEGTII